MIKHHFEPIKAKVVSMCVLTFAFNIVLFAFI